MLHTNRGFNFFRQGTVGSWRNPYPVMQPNERSQRGVLRQKLNESVHDPEFDTFQCSESLLTQAKGSLPQ